jgi:hypothetical protein
MFFLASARPHARRAVLRFFALVEFQKEGAVLTAATPAATAAFLATRLTFGRSVFFVFVGLFALVVFLVFDLLRARFSNDLAFVRLTLFFMIPPR